MAKIKYSALVSGMRNKLNGSVASRNRYGDFWRNKTTPVNAQTAFQTNVRSLFAQNSSAWRGLTQAQRDGWIAAAPNYPFTDVFGDQMILSGNSLFLKLNQNLSNINAAGIEDAPLPVAIPSLGEVSLTSTDGAYSFAFDNSISGAFEIMVFACANVSPGKNYVKNLYKYVGHSSVLTSPLDVTSMITGRFGQPTAGQKVFVKCLVVSTATGQQGLPSQASVIATALP